MSKNYLSSLIKILGFCLVFGLLIGVGFAQAQTPPSNNVPGPLNVGSSSQSKEGSLLITNGGIYTQTNGLFHGYVVVGYTAPSGGGAPSGETPSAYLQKNEKEGFFTKLARFLGLNTEKAVAQIVGGGVIGVPLEVTPTTYQLTVNGTSNLKGYTKVEGSTAISGTITSSSLVHTPAAGTTESQLCVTATGLIKICGTEVALPPPTPLSAETFESSGCVAVPTGVTSMKVTAIGGGGGGGGGGGIEKYTGYEGGAGGGAGGNNGSLKVDQILPVAAGQNICVNIGTHGNGGSYGIGDNNATLNNNNGSNGSAGGNTTVRTGSLSGTIILTVNGGGGGFAGQGGGGSSAQQGVGGASNGGGPSGGGGGGTGGVDSGGGGGGGGGYPGISGSGFTAGAGGAYGSNTIGGSLSSYGGHGGAGGSGGGNGNVGINGSAGVRGGGGGGGGGGGSGNGGADYCSGYLPPPLVLDKCPAGGYGAAGGDGYAIINWVQ